MKQKCCIIRILFQKRCLDYGSFAQEIYVYDYHGVDSGNRGDCSVDQVAGKETQTREESLPIMNTENSKLKT